MSRWPLIILIVLPLGCSTAPFDSAKARESLKAQADEACQAMKRQDYQRMLEVMWPAAVEQLGGEKKCKELLEKIADEMKREGTTIDEMALAEPGEIVSSGDNIYAIAPYTMRISLRDGPSGKTTIATAKSYLISVSTDRGGNWKFIDGEGIGGNRPKLLKLLPGFPEKLTLPALKDPELKS